jgi:hypothetical protein
MKKNAYFSIDFSVYREISFCFNLGDIFSFFPLILNSVKGVGELKDQNFDSWGYLTLLDKIKGKIILTLPFGEIPEEKKEKYFSFSQEKAWRLFSQIKNGHFDSFQSRNEEENQYGGAVYFGSYLKNMVFSFSSERPELIDEAIILVLADLLVLKNYQDQMRKEIKTFQRNTYWPIIKANLRSYQF